MSERQRDVVTGVLMSDGHINRRKNRLPRLKVVTINREYLEYLDDIFDVFSTSNISCYRTAQQSKDSTSLKRFEGSNYSDQYTWTSRSLPELKEWAKWYSSGTKVWPDDIELTPTVLKHLHAGDGSLHKENRVVTIYLSNEKDNKDKVNSYFKNANLPEPIWEEQKRRDGSISARIRWNKSESEELLEYMGEPVKGHEYKW